MGTYHRAQRLGEGAFGSVCTVYDDEGNVSALKIFDPDEEDGTLDLCTLREVSIMRLLRGKRNGHPGVLDVYDVIEIDDKIGIVMPKFPCNLEGALEGGLFKKRAQKVLFAHKLLSALAFLHDNGIMHRDIKGDNIMLTDDLSPVLIDFSLAKFVGHHHDDEILAEDEEDDEGGDSETEKKRPKLHESSTDKNHRHTGDMGTATYMAPEVYRKQRYGCKADVWSAGVVLVELFRGKTLDAEKDKAAFRMIQAIKAKMPDKPMPNLLKRMLTEDPSERPHVREILRAEIFAKRTLDEPSVRLIDTIPRALRGGDDATATKIADAKKGGKKKSGKKNGGKKKGGGGGVDSLLRRVKSIYDDLEFQNPRTLSAAMRYAEKTGAGLDDEDDDGDFDEDEEVPVSLEHCLIVAMKLFEHDKYDLDDTEDLDDALPEDSAGFDIDEFAVAEMAIFKAMDYCLYDFPHDASAGKGTDDKKRKRKKKKKKGKK